jgi:hypothetical protein
MFSLSPCFSLDYTPVTFYLRTAQGLKSHLQGLGTLFPVAIAVVVEVV